MRVKYVVITPVRDEAAHIEKTIQSMIAQTMLPIKWIIVNDGSTDDTGRIIDSYVGKCGWIKTIHRENRGFRKSGGGVVEAFYDGYLALNVAKWNFIVKLDGDLSFDGDYFEKCFERFRLNPQLGIGGGVILNVVNGMMILEKHQEFHVRGATKIYRKECWDIIGGLLRAPGWDTLDEVKANMMGWKTRSFTDLKLVHHRPTGAADGTWHNFVKNGTANYISGYHPLFMILKCIKRLTEKPYIVVSAGLMYGFVSGYLKRMSQVDDRDLIKYLRKQQLKRLVSKNTIWK